MSVYARGWVPGQYHAAPPVDDVVSPHKLGPEVCALFMLMPDTDATELAMWLFVARHVTGEEDG